MLYWIVHKIDGKPAVFISEAEGGALARLKAAIAGFGGEYAELHELDATRARKVPRRMIGRRLTEAEVASLLARLGAGK